MALERQGFNLADMLSMKDDLLYLHLHRKERYLGRGKPSATGLSLVQRNKKMIKDLCQGEYFQSAMYKGTKRV